MNYKILGLIKLYDFGIKFVSIRDHMNVMNCFYVRTFVGSIVPSPASKNYF